MKTKHFVVGLSIICIIIIIFALDILLVHFGWPTFSQTLRYWTAYTPLIPFFGGFLMGGLAVHFWEDYDEMDK